MIQKKIEQILSHHRKNLEKNGYSFNYIKPDNQQYGQFNAITGPPELWYGHHYIKNKYI